MASAAARGSLVRDCGALVIGGFLGTTLPNSFRRALESGERGGAVLFRRNLVDVRALVELTNELWGASEGVPLVAIDQEGGRVARLGPPFLVVPPALSLGELPSEDRDLLIEEIACAQALELAAVGITANFAPVFDVHSLDANPIIGDRAFGRTAQKASSGALAYARGLMRGGVLACAKHYPGHGNTKTDSHLDLPLVSASAEELEALEIAPFRAAAKANIALMMTAHVVYPGLDSLPATLSHRIATKLLRDGLGFQGALISDDLEMRAISDRYKVEEAAVLAVAAGCDAVLVCEHEELQVRAHESLVREAEGSPVFRARVAEASARMSAARASLADRSRPTLDQAMAVLSDQSTRDLSHRIEQRLHERRGATSGTAEGAVNS